MYIESNKRAVKGVKNTLVCEDKKKKIVITEHTADRDLCLNCTRECKKGDCKAAQAIRRLRNGRWKKKQ